MQAHSTPPHIMPGPTGYIGMQPGQRYVNHLPPSVNVNGVAPSLVPNGQYTQLAYRQGSQSQPGIPMGRGAGMTAAQQQQYQQQVLAQQQQMHLQQQQQQQQQQQRHAAHHQYVQQQQMQQQHALALQQQEALQHQRQMAAQQQAQAQSAAQSAGQAGPLPSPALSAHGAAANGYIQQQHQLASQQYSQPYPVQAGVARTMMHPNASRIAQISSNGNPPYSQQHLQAQAQQMYQQQAGHPQEAAQRSVSQGPQVLQQQQQNPHDRVQSAQGYPSIFRSSPTQIASAPAGGDLMSGVNLVPIPGTDGAGPGLSEQQRIAHQSTRPLSVSDRNSMSPVKQGHPTGRPDLGPRSVSYSGMQQTTTSSSPAPSNPSPTKSIPMTATASQPHLSQSQQSNASAPRLSISTTNLQRPSGTPIISQSPLPFAAQSNGSPFVSPASALTRNAVNGSRPTPLEPLPEDAALDLTSRHAQQVLPNGSVMAIGMKMSAIHPAPLPQFQKDGFSAEVAMQQPFIVSSPSGRAVMRLLGIGRSLTAAVQQQDDAHLYAWINDYFTPDAQARFNLFNATEGEHQHDVPVAALARFYTIVREEGAHRFQLLLEEPEEHEIRISYDLPPIGYTVRCDNATFAVEYTNGILVSSKGAFRANLVTPTDPSEPLKIESVDYQFSEHKQFVDRAAIISRPSTELLKSLDVQRDDHSLKDPSGQNDDDDDLDEPAQRGSKRQRLQDDPSARSESDGSSGSRYVTAVIPTLANASAISDRATRVLEIAEAVDHISELIQYAVRQNLPPLEANSSYATLCAAAGAVDIDSLFPGTQNITAYANGTYAEGPDGGQTTNNANFVDTRTPIEMTVQ